MAIRKILTYPDKQLMRVSAPVDRFDEELAGLASDMVETMRDAPGIGLAAPQVGELLRLIVVEIAPDDRPEDAVLYKICNPVIIHREGQARMEEGCLSVPGLYVEVDRAAKISLAGQNIDGSPFSLDCDGLLAICFQHEIEHLDGKLLVHYVSSVKRELYRKEMKRRETSDEPSIEDRRPAL